MSNKKQIYKPKPISGFPEWLPNERIVEQQWFNHIRATFERYGYCSIETPSVEALDVINAKGGDGEADVDKEIYVLERLHKEEGDKDARLALHFDQTIPLARYVAQHFNDLIFPFKRYQIQRVWRGERPQAGRFREFYQCDIDVINVDNLPLHFDGEMPAIIWEILSSLPGMDGEKIQIRISNRKILMGFLDSLNIPNEDESTSKVDPNLIPKILRDIDKLDKLGQKIVLQRIEETFIQAGYRSSVQNLIVPFVELCKIKYSSGNELEDALVGCKDIDTSHPTLKEGVEELSFVMEQLSHLPEGAVVADLSIVRGLDYYTGTVYETVFLDDPGYGSICSGGRYDDLASSYINKTLPGVGISIGFSRLFDRLRVKGKLDTRRHSPADILITSPHIPSDTDPAAHAPNTDAASNTAIASSTAASLDTATAPNTSDTASSTPAAPNTDSSPSSPTQIALCKMQEVGRILRKRGFNVEVWHNTTAKLKRQLAYAEKKGIPYVWFPPFEDGADHEVKNMDSGKQVSADPAKWSPDE